MPGIVLAIVNNYQWTILTVVVVVYLTTNITPNCRILLTKYKFSFSIISKDVFLYSRFEEVD